MNPSLQSDKFIIVNLLLEAIFHEFHIGLYDFHINTEFTYHFSVRIQCSFNISYIFLQVEMMFGDRFHLSFKFLTQNARISLDIFIGFLSQSGNMTFYIIIIRFQNSCYLFGSGSRHMCIISRFFLPLLYRNEKRTANENRGVGTRNDANKERERKMPGCFRADDVEHDERENGGERRVDGTDERLRDAVPHDGGKIFPVSCFARDAEVLAYTVKHDDSVVHREAEHDKKRGHKKRIHFISD